MINAKQQRILQKITDRVYRAHKKGLTYVEKDDGQRELLEGVAGDRKLSDGLRRRAQAALTTGQVSAPRERVNTENEKKYLADLDKAITREIQSGRLTPVVRDSFAKTHGRS